MLAEDMLREYDQYADVRPARCPKTIRIHFRGERHGKHPTACGHLKTLRDLP